MRFIDRTAPCAAAPLAALLFPLLFLSGPASSGAASTGAQWAPVRPVRLIVPIAPGGSNDLLARAIAQKFQESLGQPVVVDNRAGGGGTIGTEMAARATADGHTLLMVNISHAVNPAIFRKLPYSVTEDFSAIGSIALSPNVLLAHPALQVASVQELLRLAGARPSELRYGSAGIASSPHLAMELMKLTTGAGIMHVPYKGTGLALTALLGNEVSLLFSTLPPAVPLIKSGRLRALAISTAKRSAIAPDIPTLDESGVKGFDFSAWFGLMTRAGTPPSAIARFNEDLARIVSLKDVSAKFSVLGFELGVGTPAEFDRYVRSEMSRWQKVVKAADIKAE